MCASWRRNRCTYRLSPSLHFDCLNSWLNPYVSLHCSSQALKSFNAFSSVNALVVRVTDEEREKALSDRHDSAFLASLDATSGAASAAAVSADVAPTATGSAPVWTNVYFNVPDRQNMTVTKFSVSSDANGVVSGVRRAVRFTGHCSLSSRLTERISFV